MTIFRVGVQELWVKSRYVHARTKMDAIKKATDLDVVVIDETDDDFEYNGPNLKTMNEWYVEKVAVKDLPKSLRRP